MRAWIISDLHSKPMDYFYSPLVIPEADICINAGDTCDHVDFAVDYLLTAIAQHMPVVTTLGNHDYYGSSIDRALEIARKRTAGTSVQVLENDTFEMGELRVIGATLWTDFEVPFGDPDGGEELPLDVRRDMAFHTCPREVADFSEIYRSDERREGETGRITIQEMIRRHKESRAYIERELSKPFDGSTVILSHHAPSPRSIHPRFLGYASNAAYASDLTPVIREGKPNYWIHGHVHHFLDYVEGETRILCNARGMLHERDTNGFRPGFVIDV